MEENKSLNLLNDDQNKETANLSETEVAKDNGNQTASIAGTGSSSSEAEYPDFIEDDKVFEEMQIHLTNEELKERLDRAEDLRLLGNSLFKEQNWEEAASKYTIALIECPVKFKKERSVMFANRAAAKVKMGKMHNALQDCNRAIALDESYLKAFMRRAALHEELDKLDESLEDFKQALLLDPGNKEISTAVGRLEHKVNERNERLKADAMKSLKQLGNLFLKPFGLSTDHFQMVPNETGGYSINMKQEQNPPK